MPTSYEAMEAAVMCSIQIQSNLQNYQPPGPVKDIKLQTKTCINAGLVSCYHVGGMNNEFSFNSAENVKSFHFSIVFIILFHSVDLDIARGLAQNHKF